MRFLGEQNCTVSVLSSVVTFSRNIFFVILLYAHRFVLTSLFSQASYAAAVEAAKAAARSSEEGAESSPAEVIKPLLLSAPRYALYREQPPPSNETATAAVAAAIAAAEEAAAEESAAEAAVAEDSPESESCGGGSVGGAVATKSQAKPTLLQEEDEDESASLLPLGSVCIALRQRRKLLEGGPAASKWQSIRCDGASVALPGGVKALRVADKMYRETMATCDLRMTNVSLRFMEVEGEYRRLFPLPECQHVVVNLLSFMCVGPSEIASNFYGGGVFSYPSFLPCILITAT